MICTLVFGYAAMLNRAVLTPTVSQVRHLLYTNTIDYVKYMKYLVAVMIIFCVYRLSSGGLACV